MQLFGPARWDTAGGENGTADPFRDEVVSLLVMTVTGQGDARSSCRATS
jgi:hypothetical protein